MSDLQTSIVLLLAESSIVLIVLLGLIGFFWLKNYKRHKKLALQLVEKIRSNETDKKQSIVTLLKEQFEMSDDKSVKLAESMVKCEKTLYSHILKLYMGHDPEKILDMDRDVDELIDCYRHLIEGGSGEDSAEQGDGGASLIVKLRKENQSLRDERTNLQHQLTATMHTMEGIMSEYSSMYEGGKQAGEQRMKNEMFKLQQKLEKSVKAEDDEMDLSEEEKHKLESIGEGALESQDDDLDMSGGDVPELKNNEENR